jgi:HEPN domain-containing protein
MQRSDSSNPADWLAVAEKDLTRLRRALRAHDPDQAGIYLQQAVEKFLKAFLLSCGVTIPRIHILDVLLTEAIAYDPAIGQYLANLSKDRVLLYAGSLSHLDEHRNHGADRS